MNDYPDQAKAFLFAHPAWCRKQAEELGEHVALMVGEILAPHSLRNLRKAQGVIRLGAKYGAVKLDEACRHLLCFGTTYMSSLKRVLEKGIPAKDLKLPVPDISYEGEQCLHPPISFGEVAL